MAVSFFFFSFISKWGGGPLPVCFFSPWTSHHVWRRRQSKKWNFQFKQWKYGNDFGFHHVHSWLYFDLAKKIFAWVKPALRVTAESLAGQTETSCPQVSPPCFGHFLRLRPAKGVGVHGAVWLILWVSWVHLQRKCLFFYLLGMPVLAPLA